MIPSKVEVETKFFVKGKLHGRWTPAPGLKQKTNDNEEQLNGIAWKILSIQIEINSDCKCNIGFSKENIFVVTDNLNENLWWNNIDCDLKAQSVFSIFIKSIHKNQPSGERTADFVIKDTEGRCLYVAKLEKACENFASRPQPSGSRLHNPYLEVRPLKRKAIGESDLPVKKKSKHEEKRELQKNRENLLNENFSRVEVLSSVVNQTNGASYGSRIDNFRFITEYLQNPSDLLQLPLPLPLVAYPNTGELSAATNYPPAELCVEDLNKSLGDYSQYFTDELRGSKGF